MQHDEEGEQGDALAHKGVAHTPMDGRSSTEDRSSDETMPDSDNMAWNEGAGLSNKPQAPGRRLSNEKTRWTVSFDLAHCDKKPWKHKVQASARSGFCTNASTGDDQRASLTSNAQVENE